MDTDRPAPGPLEEVRHLLNSDDRFHGVDHARDVDALNAFLDLAGSAYFELNDTAALLWPALVGGTDDAELTRILAEAGPADAAADVQTFLDELQAAGLLLREQPAT